jgi:prolipoprotein diacylglyceryltransferase
MSPRLSYAAFMLFAAGVFLLVRRCTPTPPEVAALPRLDRFALAGAAFVGGVFGAKIPFVSGADLPSDAAWLADGKTITTGLMGAYLAVELVKFALGIRVKTGDTFALPLALALTVGRWGCFFNGCCFGTPTDLPWGVEFQGIVRHPTQAYESLFHLGMACVLVVLSVRNAMPGNRLKFYLITYAVFRFATEFIRPEPEYSRGLTYYQWVSLVFATGLVAQWLFATPSKPPVPTASRLR